MCGRFTATFSMEDLVATYGVAPSTVGPPRFNVCPTQQVLVIRQDAAGCRTASSIRWGLVPHWAKELSIGAKMTNARCETVAEKPAFRSAIKARRCIVPGSGWYEWTTVAGKKVPHYFTRRNGAPCSFAGIWEAWKGTADEIIETCSILTTEANELMRSIHDRMPVILAPDDLSLWLDHEVNDPSKLQHLYRPFASSQLQKWEVSPLVNSARYDMLDCIRPILPQETSF